MARPKKQEKDVKIAIYIKPSIKIHFEKEATDNDKTLSEVVRGYLEKEIGAKNV